VARASVACVLGTPLSGVGHRCPRLLRRQVAVLQEFDRDQVRRAHEGHVAVARRAVDRVAQRLQAFAGGVDVGDAERQVAEVAGAAVILGLAVLRRPVVRQLDLGVRGFVGGEEDQGEAPGRVLHAARFLQAEAFAVEAQRRVDVADADHGVEVFHGRSPGVGGDSVMAREWAGGERCFPGVLFLPRLDPSGQQALPAGIRRRAGQCPANASPDPRLRGRRQVLVKPGFSPETDPAAAHASDRPRSRTGRSRPPRPVLRRRSGSARGSRPPGAPAPHARRRP
jgi:hypothetical protein